MGRWYGNWGFRSSFWFGFQVSLVQGKGLGSCHGPRSLSVSLQTRSGRRVGRRGFRAGLPAEEEYEAWAGEECCREPRPRPRPARPHPHPSPLHHLPVAGRFPSAQARTKHIWLGGASAGCRGSYCEKPCEGGWVGGGGWWLCGKILY